jgi:o-succinylbenzoate synthase
MLESGIGRAHNLHIASLPDFKMPSDLSASKRYYTEDLIDPAIELEADGTIRVPVGPGIGVNPVEDRIAKATLKHETFKP